MTKFHDDLEKRNPTEFLNDLKRSYSTYLRLLTKQIERAKSLIELEEFNKKIIQKTKSIENSLRTHNES